MVLEDLGYILEFEKFRKEQNLEGFDVGRVLVEHRERYIVRTTSGEFEAEVTGNMRFTAKNREDFPAVGDWVAISTYDSDFAVIHRIFPRFSLIERRAVGKYAEVQVIAANVDFAFIVQSIDRDFNINRLERYIAICNTSKVSPIIVFTKTDLVDEDRINEILSAAKKRIKGLPVIAVSNITRNGFNEIESTIEKGKTYCMLGSSGVGKSTILNNLLGENKMETGSISQITSRGKHITSHRELVVLNSGGILIDNPGMREVGITDSNGGLETTFDLFTELSKGCKFIDCTHTSEIGCCILDALEKGEIDGDSYENYLKLLKEKVHFESTVAEKRRKEKVFGKILKKYKKDMNKDAF